MKNVFFLFALLCAFFSSCSDEDGANVTTSNVKLPHVVTINSGDKVTCSSNTKSQVKVLAFDNMRKALITLLVFLGQRHHNNELNWLKVWALKAWL